MDLTRLGRHLIDRQRNVISGTGFFAASGRERVGR